MTITIPMYIPVWLDFSFGCGASNMMPPCPFFSRYCSNRDIRPSDRLSGPASMLRCAGEFPSRRGTLTRCDFSFNMALQYAPLPGQFQADLYCNSSPTLFYNVTPQTGGNDVHEDCRC